MKLSPRRYLLVKADSPVPLFGEQVDCAAREAVLEAFGEKGLADSGLRLKEFNAQTRHALLKVSLPFQERAIAALALKRSYCGRPIALRLEKIFGNLRKPRPLFPGSKPATRRKRAQNSA
ncbi:MAG: Rpp14/Pop5 family protein [Candidatus Micrarchaeota archaeon]